MRLLLSSLAAGAVALTLTATVQAAPAAGGLLPTTANSAMHQDQPEMQQINWRHRHQYRHHRYHRHHRHYRHYQQYWH